MLHPDALWYKDAIVYQIPVHAFYDGNGDGIGDFRGLKEKLGYLRALGADALWLLPFYPSPMRDGGYDISDYYGIHPDLGTLDDFKDFLEAAHRVGMRVLADLVLNHTSDQHQWFQEARLSHRSPRRDWYVWSDDPSRYGEARIIFRDLEPSNWSWDSVAKSYYWHRFYYHQPDLNYDNPELRDAMKGVVRYWLHMGVDGFRCDAVPYLFERDGTRCEGLSETHAFLKELRRMIDEEYPGRVLLAEANHSPETLRSYFGECDEFHMAFHFPLMPRIFTALARGEGQPIEDILKEVPPIPEGCQWGVFLRNHDELTLSKVSEEEREYLLSHYAPDPRMRLNGGIRRRLAPLLGNDRRRIELAHGLLLSMPGSPILYYGDEIGMGDNIYLGDRNGVRTPMQWSDGENAGFSGADRSQLYIPPVEDPPYGYHAVNVEAQERTPDSLLARVRQLIAIRRRHGAFSRGSMEFLKTDNRRILAFTRSYQGETLLAVFNLSDQIQRVELGLQRFADCVPVDLLSENSLPAVGESPYGLILAPHGFFWLQLNGSPMLQDI
ncbi:MAG: maltose alpha-D-glucosyltransferase, partial [Chloroflexota bacterium]